MTPKHAFSAVILILAATLVAGCKPSYPPSKPVDQLTPTEYSGYVIYQRDCSSCHYADHTGDLHGPSLYAMYRKPYLPSGAPANDDRVSAAITNGHGIMPGFGNQINPQQLKDLLAYLHTL